MPVTKSPARKPAAKSKPGAAKSVPVKAKSASAKPKSAVTKSVSVRAKSASGEVEAGGQGEGSCAQARSQARSAQAGDGARRPLRGAPSKK